MRNIVKPAIGSLFLFLFLIALMDFGLRFLPEPRYASNIVFDPLLGHRGPISSFVDFCYKKIFYNQFGYRDLPYIPEEERRNGRVRVAVLGDSITEGIDSTDVQLWTKWLENILDAAMKQKSTVYRFVSSDWGTLQQLLSLKRDADQIDPNVVVLQFLGLNDFINNSLAFAEKNMSDNDNWRPYLDPDSDYEIVSVDPIKNMFRRLSSIYRIYDAYQVRNHLHGLQMVRFDYKGCSKYMELFSDSPKDPNWKKAFDVTAHIAKLMGEHRKKNQVFIAVYFPSHIEILDKVWAYQMQTCKALGPLNRLKAEEIFNKVFKDAGIEVLSLTKRFRDHPKQEELFDGTGHLSPLGHQFAGEEIAFYLHNFHSGAFGGKK